MALALYEKLYKLLNCKLAIEECDRELELRWNGRWFKPRLNYCVVSLNKAFYPLLSTSSTHETSWHD